MSINIALNCVNLYSLELQVSINIALVSCVFVNILLIFCTFFENFLNVFGDLGMCMFLFWSWI